ncbi:hypothetical protein ACWXWU_01960 [Shewanella sp. A14]
MAKFRLLTRRWRKKMRRFILSKRGKLVFVLSGVLAVFAFTCTLEYFVTPHHLWHFTCKADGYFSSLNDPSVNTEPSELLLHFHVEHQQASLRYQLQAGPSFTESAQLYGEVNSVDLGTLSYELDLSIAAAQWQSDSALRGYLASEFSLDESQMEITPNFPLHVQILNIDNEQSRTTLKFIPSNNLWSCQMM